jgi:hypothetical protein
MRAEGMGWTEFQKLVFDERRDPVSIPLINLPGEPDEGHEVLLIFHFFSLEFLSCHPDGFHQINSNEYERIL